ncbi:MAG TPA: hypothetical protein DCQ06_03985 [Myxococcales bacterium]|nr:hypothetical protein [Myxococcales bacterium]
MSTNFYVDNPDLRFHIEKNIDWSALFDAVEFNAPEQDKPASVEDALELYEDVLKELGKFTAKKVAPVARSIDKEGTDLVDGKVVESAAFTKVFKALKRLQVYGLPLPRELGGLNAPATVYLAASELMSRGDVSCMTHFGFHTGVAMSLIMYALRDERTVYVDGRIQSTPYDAQIEEMASGNEWGCMVLTESQAGSDLAQLRTSAKLGDDGLWRLNGEKIYITSGHAKYQLVLARSEDEQTAPGLKGLSLYLVEQWLERDGERVDNVRIAKVEHKIGHKGSPTCSLLYEDSVGQLIGKRGEGFHLMLVMMNFARLAVGFEGLGLMEAAYRMARDYASERVTMGKTIDRHEMIADFLEDMDLTVKAARSLMYRAAVATELSQRLEQVLEQAPPSDPKELAALKKKVKKLKRRSRNLTPLCKYVGSEEAVRVARLTMQILGGAGYTDDWEAEKLLRDALVLPIYEGTSQIQALMTLKDQMMIALQNPQKFLSKVARANFNKVTAKSKMRRGMARLYTYKYSALQTILIRIMGKKLKKTKDLPATEWSEMLLHQWDPQQDFAPGLLHAERLCRILCDVECARSLVEDARRHPERKQIALRFIQRADLRCRAELMTIEEHGESLLADLAKLRKSADDAELRSVA